MDRLLVFTYVLSVVMLVGYLALGVWSVRTAWAWSTSLQVTWARAFIVSTVITVFFAPGLAGGGHGVAPVPAWLMFATGTFRALTTESQRIYLVTFLAFWFVTFGVVWAVINRQKRT